MKDTTSEDKSTLPILEVALDPGPEDALLVGGEIGEALEGTELEKIVDADLVNFADFYKKTLKNEVFTNFEKAAIKTYIWWKTHKVT